MRSATYHLTTSAARADALFASALQPSGRPTAAQVRQAVNTALAAFGPPGCAARVAQAYGEHPETAAPRMRWARATVAHAAAASPEPACAPGTQPPRQSATCRAA
jgi:uncharacterized membrane protein